MYINGFEKLKILKLFCFIIIGKRTAIHLTGRHGRHDYINANKIEVIY
jgi:hypothetical protein